MARTEVRKMLAQFESLRVTGKDKARDRSCISLKSYKGVWFSCHEHFRKIGSDILVEKSMAGKRESRHGNGETDQGATAVKRGGSELELG